MARNQDARRTAENGIGRFSINCGKIYGETGKAAVQNLAGLFEESCRRYRGVRLFHRAHCDVQNLVRVLLAFPRPPQGLALQRDRLAVC